MIGIGLAIVLLAGAYLINPIRILIVKSNELLQINPLSLRILFYAAVIIPLVGAIYFVFIHDKVKKGIRYVKSHASKDSYVVKPEDYHTPSIVFLYLKINVRIRDNKVKYVIKIKLTIIGFYTKNSGIVTF